MKPFYLILTLIPALLIGRTVSAQISVDEVDAGEESVTFQDKLKSIPVDVDYFSRARYKAERAAIRKERNYLEFNSGVQGALTSYNDPWISSFAGIDPTVRQSGEFNSTHNHMSKRGSPYLRHAIFLAATTCSFHNSPLNAYYKKKRDQGKHHLTATGAVARKLTSVIYAVLRDSKPYEPKSFC